MQSGRRTDYVVDSTRLLSSMLALRDLTAVHETYIFVHMRTTLNIDGTLIREASKLTGISEKTALVRMGLEALIAKESARRLASLGGTEKGLRPIPRRRAKSIA